MKKTEESHLERFYAVVAKIVAGANVSADEIAEPLDRLREEGVDLSAFRVNIGSLTPPAGFNKNKY